MSRFPSGGRWRRAVAALVLLMALVASVLGDGNPVQANQSNRTFLLLEEGDDTTISVRLPRQPTNNNDVTVTLTSGDEDAVTVSDESLTFTRSNYNVTQDVTVSAVDDTDTNDERVTIRLRANGSGANNGGYDNVEGAPVTVHVADEDNTDGLLSNWLQKPTRSFDTARFAQRFRTGSNSDGYDITSIGVVLSGGEVETGSAEPDNYEMLIRRNDNGDVPGTMIHKMSNPSSFSYHSDDRYAGELSLWTPSAGGLRLDPNSRYWVVVGERPNSAFPDRVYGGLRRTLTASGGEDPTNASGWAVENWAYAYRPAREKYTPAPLGQVRLTTIPAGWYRAGSATMMEIKGTERTSRRRGVQEDPKQNGGENRDPLQRVVKDDTPGGPVGGKDPAETPANNSATGAPTISGTARVGQTLTADTSGISDDDGLTNVSYSYQWIRNDGTDDSDIADATGSTYTLTDDDQGKTVKVKVDFSDDEDNEESLTSQPTGTVAPPPLTASFENAAASHNGSESFTLRVKFSEAITQGTKNNMRRALSLTGVNLSRILRVDSRLDLFEITLAPTGNGDATITLGPSSTDCEANDAICTGDGTALTGTATATIPGPPDEAQGNGTSDSLTARFRQAPASHDGSTEFTLRVKFSEKIAQGTKNNMRRALSLTGVNLKRILRVNNRLDLFEITFAPTANGAATITLGPSNTDCEANDAICTDDGTALTGTVTKTISYASP